MFCRNDFEVRFVYPYFEFVFCRGDVGARFVYPYFLCSVEGASELCSCIPTLGLCSFEGMS